MKPPRRRGLLTWRLHPIWRGIGFLMMIILPVIGYGLADMAMNYLLEQNQNLSLELASLDVNAQLYLLIAMTLLFTILLYLIFSVFASLLYSLMGGGENEEVISRIGSGRRRY
jgi:hypothetical protein